MADATAIEWSDATWNPVQGCSKVSPGCAHCYAEALTARYAGGRGWIEEHRPWTPENAEHNVRLRPDRLDQPDRWRKPRMVFVNSMSDLFHELVPDEFIVSVWNVMARNPRHTFQILTKRPERMRDLLLKWSDYGDGTMDAPEPNVWLGTSIENRRFVGRADVLREVPAAVRFISAEPLLGPLTDGLCLCCRAELGHYDLCFECANNLCGDCYVDEETLERPVESVDPYAKWPSGRLSLNGVDWLIVGGESGPKARPMQREWVTDLREAARASGTAFFFKQWGGRTPKAGGRELDGRTWDEMPRVPVPA